MDFTLDSAAFVVKSLSDASILKASRAADDTKDVTNGAADDAAEPVSSPPPPSSSSSRPSRGALLAQLEFLRQSKDNGFEAEAKTLVDSAINLVRVYFDHFGDKPSFFADIKTWLPLVQGEDIEGLVHQLAPLVGAENLLKSPVNSAETTLPATVSTARET